MTGKGKRNQRDGEIQRYIDIQKEAERNTERKTRERASENEGRGERKRDSDSN